MIMAIKLNELESKETIPSRVYGRLKTTEKCGIIQIFGQPDDK
jgi:hypothetical protein